MNDFLKGNYSLPPDKGPRSTEPYGDARSAETAEAEFERRALEKLGGSIAFVVKSSFVWNGDNAGESGDKPS